MKVKRINAQVKTGGHDIEEPKPENMSVNELDTNADTCCLVSNFTVLQMTSIKADVYPYNPSCKPLYNVPIVSGETTVTDSITVKSFIVVINEALYYGKKLDHSIINSNQLRCYETMVWENPLDPYRDLCIKTGDGNMIDLTPNGTKIGFSSHVPTDKDLRMLPHIEVTSGSEWNPNNMKLGKMSMDKNDDAFELQQCLRILNPKM